MAKHKFMIAKSDHRGLVIGVQCVSCGRFARYEDGKVPDDIREEECEGKEDVS